MIGYVVWGLLLGACLAWEALGLMSPHDRWPTLSDMLDLVTRTPLGRCFLLALWLWVGWHLFIRGWSPFLRDPAPRSSRALSSAPISIGAIGPVPGLLLLLVPCALLVAVLVLCARRAGRSGSPVQHVVPVAARTTFLRYLLVTVSAGYLLFLGALALYGFVADEPTQFFSEAVSGGGFLAFIVATPCFVVATYIAGVRRTHHLVTPTPRQSRD